MHPALPTEAAFIVAFPITSMETPPAALQSVELLNTPHPGICSPAFPCTWMASERSVVVTPPTVCFPSASRHVPPEPPPMIAVALPLTEKGLLTQMFDNSGSWDRVTVAPIAV